MLFSELYSVYYHTVAKIIAAAFREDVTEKDLQQCVVDGAFSESVLTILPALKSGRWPLLNEDLSPVLHHPPTMPLTLLEKRWLKAISEDPRIRLFVPEIPGLEDVDPLFTNEDYKIYDQYTDGDPFEDETYIRHFQILREAIREHRPVRITVIGRTGREHQLCLYPEELEYSLKDDKIRILASGCRYRRFNLGRVTQCDFCDGYTTRKKPQPEQVKELTLQIIDERNALERAMLHFAHFEKRAEKSENNRYLLRLKYYGSDETEIVIRVLSFGPYVKVLEPQSFVNLIKERLISQKSCEFP